MLKKTRLPGVMYRYPLKDGKPDRKGERQYVIRYRDENGKQRQERAHGDMASAERQLADVKARLRGGAPVSPQKITVGELWDEWAAAAYPKLAPSSVRNYTSVGKSMVLPALGSVPIQKLDEHRLAKWVSTLEERGLKGASIRSAMKPLGQVLRYAIRRKLIPSNPITRLNKNELPKNDAKGGCPARRGTSRRRSRCDG